MKDTDRIAQLQDEVAKLKADKEMLEKTVAQLQSTLNRMIDRYVTGSKETS